jgi:hypothetical protein
MTETFQPSVSVKQAETRETFLTETHSYRGFSAKAFHETRFSLSLGRESLKRGLKRGAISEAPARNQRERQ